MAKKKTTVRSKTLDERIVEAFKKMAEECDYDIDCLERPTFQYSGKNKDYEEVQEILEELASAEQKTKSYTVNLTADDKDTVESELDGWCLSASAKASIRKALKI